MNTSTSSTSSIVNNNIVSGLRRFSARRALALVLLAGAAAVGPTLTSSAAPADCVYNPNGRGGLGTYLDKIAIDQRDWEIDVFNMINSYRAQNSLPALTFSRTLARPAMWASIDSYNMGISPSNHIDSRGMNIAQRVEFCSGYRGGFVAEINFWGRGDQSYTAPAAALNFWKNSPGHNALLLSRDAKFMAVGLAYEGDDRHRTHYTVVFGDH